MLTLLYSLLSLLALASSLPLRKLARSAFTTSLVFIGLLTVMWASSLYL